MTMHTSSAALGSACLMALATLFARSTPFSHDGDAPPAATSGSASNAVLEPEGRAPDTVVVTIRKFMFDTITVNAGDVVVWRNSDQVEHTLTADSGAFESPLIKPGQRWSFRFTAPGTYAYHCILHPFMKADVRVTTGSIHAVTPDGHQGFVELPTNPQDKTWTHGSMHPAASGIIAHRTAPWDSLPRSWSIEE